MKVQVLLALFSKLSAAVSSLLFLFVISKQLPAEDVGLLALTQSLAIVISVICRFGLDTQLIKTIAQLDCIRLKQSAVHNSICFVFITSCLLSIAILLLVTLNAFKFTLIDTLSELGAQLFLICILISVLNVQCAALNALNKVSQSIFLSSGLPFLIALLGVFISHISSIDDIAWFLVSGYLIANLIAHLLLRSVLKVKLIPRVNKLKLPKLNFHFMVIAVAAISTQHLSQVFISPYIPLADLASFAIALKVSLVAAYPLQVSNRILMPMIAKEHSLGYFDKIKGAMAKSQILLAICGVIYLLLAKYLGHGFFIIINEDFKSANTYLLILLVGQLINLSTGCAVSVLLMAGHEKIHRNNTVAMSFVFLLGLLLITPQYGALGAAYVIAITVSAKNLIAFYFVRSRVLK